MSLFKDLEVAGDKGKARIKVLFDTGASRSIMRRDRAESITTFLKAPISLKFRLGNGKPVGISHGALDPARKSGKIQNLSPPCFHTGLSYGVKGS